MELAAAVHAPNSASGAQRCMYCNIDFRGRNSKQRLAQHLLTHTGEKPFACNHGNCGKRYVRASLLRTHMWQHVDGGDPRQVCETCGKAFTCPSNLRRHREVHGKNGSEKRFACGECAATFTRKCGLVQHMHQHQNERAGTWPFRCESCNKGFTRKSGLDKHTRLSKLHAVVEATPPLPALVTPVPPGGAVPEAARGGPVPPAEPTPDPLGASQTAPAAAGCEHVRRQRTQRVHPIHPTIAELAPRITSGNVSNIGFYIWKSERPGGPVACRTRTYTTSCKASRTDSVPDS